MSWEQGIPFPGSNMEYRSTSKDLRFWAYQLANKLKSCEDPSTQIANLCDGIGEFSCYFLKYSPNSNIHSVDLANFKKLNRNKGFYNSKITYHWNTDLIDFLKNSDENSFNLVTLIRAHFITFTPPYDTTGQMLDQAVVDNNVRELLDLLPAKIKPGGMFFFTSSLLNPTFTDGLLNKGFKPIDINQWLWVFEPNNS